MAIYEPMMSDPNESAVYLNINAALVPSTVSVRVEGLVSELAQDTPAARYYPFRPPVTDVDGNARFDGQLPDDGDLLGMCWLVQGVYDLDGTTKATVPAACVGAR